MNGDYLQPVEDGLPYRDQGEWVNEKLYYLRRYIDIFMTGMKGKKWRGFNYVDLFAGPGKNKLSETGEIVLGSPLIALEHQPPFTSFHLVEKDGPLAAALQKRVDSSPLSHTVTVYPEEASSAVDKIVAKVQREDNRDMPDKWWTLNFAFIDPEGLEGEWDIIERLIQVRKMDLLIYYPVMALNRYMPVAIGESNTAVDRFFGTEAWREIYKRHGSAAHRELIDLYQGRLRERGYAETKDFEKEPLVRTSETRVPLYRLIFASKHPLGHDFWEKISRIDPGGQTSFDWD